jgi:hypothetical protein
LNFRRQLSRKPFKPLDNLQEGWRIHERISLSSFEFICRRRSAMENTLSNSNVPPYRSSHFQFLIQKFKSSFLSHESKH